jgi:hypothetical protein
MTRQAMRRLERVGIPLVLAILPLGLVGLVLYQTWRECRARLCVRDAGRVAAPQARVRALELPADPEMPTGLMIGQAERRSPGPDLTRPRLPLRRARRRESWAAAGIGVSTHRAPRRSPRGLHPRCEWPPRHRPSTDPLSIGVSGLPAQQPGAASQRHLVS